MSTHSNPIVLAPGRSRPSLVRRIRPVALVGVCAPLLLGSCATNTQTQGTGIGAAVGGVVGAVLGKQLGDRNGLLIGAAIGSLLGGMVGHDWAKQVEARRAQYQTEEERLNVTLAEAERINAEARQQNADLANAVADREKAVNELLARLDTTRQDMANEREKLLAQANRAKSIEQNLQQANQSLLTAVASAEKASLDASQLRRQIDTLQSDLNTMSQHEAEIQRLLARLQS